MRDEAAEAIAGTPSSSLGDRRLRAFAGLYLLAIAVWLVVLGCFNLRHPSDWAMGDWLINYSGGFVRRGLVGEAALSLRALHASPLWAVLLLQWALYALVLWSVWRLLRPMCWRWWTAAFVFSPATLAFPLLDPPFAFRKEILFFALLAWLLMRFEQARRPMRDAWVSAVLVCGCAVCTLSHEGLLVYFPYLFAGLALGFRDLGRAARVFFAPAVVSVALFVLVSRFPGNAHVAEAVCRSIGGTLTEPPSGICGGAIDYLTHDSAYAHAQVRRTLLQGHAWLRLPWLFLLPLLPAVLGLRSFWRADRQAARILMGSSAVAWLLSVSVFFYGTDWTRWIYIHTFCLMLLMLFAELQGRNVAPAERAVPGRFSRPAVIGLLIYCLGWELTVYTPRPLYGSFVRFVTHQLLRGQQ